VIRVLFPIYLKSKMFWTIEQTRQLGIQLLLERVHLLWFSSVVKHFVCRTQRKDMSTLNRLGECNLQNDSKKQ
jgi:hypothetical protein